MANNATHASTTEAVAAQAQSRGDAVSGAAVHAAPLSTLRAALGKTYTIGEGIKQVPLGPYERKKTDPVFRQLYIYTIDPATRRLEAAVALVDVPYEPLQPGPVGCLFRIDDYDAVQRAHYRRADLDDKAVLIRSGYAPSQSEPRFHQQMVYAVCSNVYATFKKALGRQIAWRAGVDKLTIHPHAEENQNAYYDNGKLYFGYYPANCDSAISNTLPGGFVFTCLSHDIIAHEVTHALLDGLRAQFSLPSGPDVIAFHEAFADLVALFQRFSYAEVVRNAIQKSRNDISKANYLTDLATQFGHTTGSRKALRSAIMLDPEHGTPLQYDSNMPPHRLGSVLVSAVFEAFTQIYQYKSARYIRLASNGSGILPPGELSHDLVNVLAARASKLAGQFLSICIRALDYCPPVGLNFGDYLRALITADADIVPDDRDDYRGALIDAFRRRNIYPYDVANLSEDALLWRGTHQQLPNISALSFAQLQFQGDPGCAVGKEELLRQAYVLGEYVSRPEHLEEFGLAAQNDERLDNDKVSLPCIESIRISRRAGPDGQIVFDLVAEVTQQRFAKATGNCAAFVYYGGSTVILGPLGEVRYVILKSVLNAKRLQRRRQFLMSDIGQAYWRVKDGKWQPNKQLFKQLHDGAENQARVHAR